MSLNSTAQDSIVTRERIPARVMVVTGASGGHIFPALAFLEKLKGKHGTIDVLFVLPQPFCRPDDIFEKYPGV